MLNELIDTVLGKDEDFLKWRADHRESFVPRPVASRTDHDVPPSGTQRTRGTTRIR